MYAVVQIGSSTRKSDCAIKRRVFVSAARIPAPKPKEVRLATPAILPNFRRVSRCAIPTLRSELTGRAYQEMRCRAHPTSHLLDVPLEHRRAENHPLHVFSIGG